MIQEKKIVSFDMDFYCMFKIRNGWTGNDVITFRKVHKTTNDAGGIIYFARVEKEDINLTQDVYDFISEQENIKRWRSWYNETKF